MTDKNKIKEYSTKEKIILAAFDLFSQKGFKDISMREIAQSCGITKPVIYYYFKDKEDLCFEMVKELGCIQFKKMQDLAKTKSFPKFLEELFNSYFNNVTNKKIVGFMLHLHSYLSAHPELEKRLKSLKDEQAEVIKEYINNEVVKGRLPADTVCMAIHLIHANTLHMIVHSGDSYVTFDASYPKEITKAILRAVKYNGEIEE